MNFTFSIPTQVIFGSGVSRQAGGVLGALVAVKPALKSGILVVADPGIRNAPWMKDIFLSLEQNNLEYTVFDRVKPNPREEDIEEAARMLTAGNLAAVLVIGGGSSMDTAKAASLLASHGGKLGEYTGWAKVPGNVLPVVAIPTTAGSGSEATCWAVITDSANHTKVAIGDRNLAPAAALVDPDLTLTLPAGLTAATGMDALTHSIEAYVCALSNPINDLLALESVRLVAAHLLRAVRDGRDEAARAGMMLASTLGGIAINSADVAGVHCLSEGMGSRYDAPHGLLNAILLPWLMVHWQEGCQGKFMDIARAFKAEPTAEAAVREVKALAKALHFPSLAGLGVKKEDLPGLAELAEANVSNASNPIPMKAADYLAILEQALGE